MSFFGDIGDTLAQVAPVLLGAVAGPPGIAAGMAVKSLVGAFGGDEKDVEGLAKLIKADPDAEYKLRKLETEFEASLERLKTEVQLAQIGVNKVEAKSSSFFVAGARPAAIWLCLFLLGWQHFGYEVFYNLIVLYGANTAGLLPPGGAEFTWHLISGLLGLSGIRSGEKWKGVARENLGIKLPWKRK